MRWCLLALLPLLAGATFHYELEGVLSTIRPEDVRQHLANRAGFLPSELKVQERLSSLSEGLLKDFFIDFFEIHGEEHDKRTVIFHGYLSTDLTRIDIENLVERTEDLHIFWLVPKVSLPSPSTLTSSSSVAVDSCSNGGILLPNATCACKPFYSGESCEIVQCLHEGIQNGGRCACPPGVATLNCEPRQCIPNTLTDFDRKKTSFNLVINQEETAAAFLNSFFGELQHLDYDSYNTFIVVNYVDSAKGLYMQKKEFVYWTDMIDYLNGIVSVSSGKYHQPTNKAILAAQSFAPSMLAFSRTIVITALPDSENVLPNYALSSTNIATRLILKSIAWRSRVLYIIPVPSTPLPSGSFDIFHAVADATLGDAIYVDRNEPASQFVIPFINNLNPSEPVSIQQGKGDAHLTIPETDLILMVTVEPGEKLPSISTSNQTEVAYNAYNKILLVSDSNSVAACKGTNWVLKASVQTSSTAVISYSDDSEVDIGNAYATSNVPQFVSAKLIGIKGDASLNVIDTKNPALKDVGRTGCSFSSNFGRYNSFSTPGPFVSYLNAVENNYPLLIPGVVVILDEITPSPFQCFNGGTKLTSTSCQCVSGFLSNDCSVPMCLNGGSPSPFPGNGRDLCSCPQGHHGDHCEKLDCYSLENSQFWSQDKSLALVIQSSMSQASNNDDIVEGLVLLLVENNVAYSQLMLTTFNNIAKGGQNKTVITTNSFNNASDFINATSNVQYLASYTPNQDSLTAIQNTIESLLFDNSQIILFVDSKPTSSASINDLTQSALVKRTQVHIIVTSSFGDGQTCLDDATKQLYQKLAFNTGGYFLNFCDGSDSIENFFNLFASPFHNSQLVLEDIPQSCSKPVAFSLTFENWADTYFVINGDNVDFANFSVSVALDGSDVATGIASVSDIASLGVFKVNVAQLDPTKEYNIHVISDPSVGQGLCSSKIIVKSSAQAFFGFTDRGSTVASKSLSFGNVQTGKLYGTVLTDDPTLVSFFLSDISIERASLLVTSAKKSYSFTSQYANSYCSSQVLFPDQLVCMFPNDAYLLKTQAVTQKGQVITRTQRAWCNMKSKSCLNGATFQNNRCYCPTSFSGDFCETPSCKNGFTLDSNSQCFCSASYTGTLCESEKCDSMNFMEAADVREFDYEQVVFVVNTNIDMLLVNVYLKNMIQKFTSEAQNPANPKEFTLVTFDESNVNQVISTWDETEFSQVFIDTMSSFSKVSGQPTRSLDALRQGLRLVVKPTATVFLITGSSSIEPWLHGDSGFSILPRQKIGAQINLIYSPPGIVPISPPDDRLTTAARLTGGRVIPLTQNSLPVMQVVMASALKENALVLDDGVEDCSTDVDRSFFADSGTTRIIFDISGYGVWQHFELRDTKGQVAKLSRNFTDTGVLIAELVLPEDGSGWGDWSFSLKTTTGSCFMQVRVESKMRIIPGFTMDAHNDFPQSQPFGERAANPLTRMAFRLNGLDGAIIDGVKVEDANPSQPWNVSDGHASADVHSRDASSCAFQFLSDSFLLDKTSQYQKVNVWGLDKAGRAFKRIFFYETPSEDSDCNYGLVDDSGKCACDANHYGDECSDRRCVNGGSSSFGVCACPSGFYGMYCEKYFPYNGTSTTLLYDTTTPAELFTTSILSTLAPVVPITTQKQQEASTAEITTTENSITTTESVLPPATTTVNDGTQTVSTSFGTTSPSVLPSSLETQVPVVTSVSDFPATSGNILTSTIGVQPEATVSFDGTTTSLPSTFSQVTKGSVATGGPEVQTTVSNSVMTTTEVITTAAATQGGNTDMPGNQGTTELPPTTQALGSSATTEAVTTGAYTKRSNTDMPVEQGTTRQSGETQRSTTSGSSTNTQSLTTPSVTQGSPDVTTEAVGGVTVVSTEESVPSSAAPIFSAIPTTTTATAAVTTPQATSVAADLTSTFAVPTEAVTTPQATSVMSTLKPTYGPCDPMSTTYFYSFFIDTSDLITPPGNLFDVQNDVVSRVGELVGLGGGESSTRFAISGAAFDFYPGGIATNAQEINDLFNDGDLYSFDGGPQVDYNKGIDGYLASNYSETLPSEQPPIAVLFAKQQILGSQQDFIDHVNKLKSANYAVIGIDLSGGFGGPLNTYLTAALGSNNVYVMQISTDDTAQFIVERGCHFKPT